MADAPVIEATNLWRSYQRGSETVHALADFSMTVSPGEMVGVVGRSGSGKTNLLNQLGCLDKPTKGALSIAGTEVTDLSEKELVGFRREHIGFVFQLIYLIPTLTAAENLRLPQLFSRRDEEERVRELCNRVGLNGKLHLRPHSMSGGDRQRVAIARALVNQPKILLADEPTGRLESQARDEILDLFNELRGDGLCIVLATHDLQQAARCDRVIELSDGRRVGETRPGDPELN